ncbi:MAG: hypothetical protein JWQ71_4401 [Pedosphaera sp.]|nr:hypothetical protein [Pedosphaera sp.]
MPFREQVQQGNDRADILEGEIPFEHYHGNGASIVIKGTVADVAEYLVHFRRKKCRADSHRKEDGSAKPNGGIYDSYESQEANHFSSIEKTLVAAKRRFRTEWRLQKVRRQFREFRAFALLQLDVGGHRFAAEFADDVIEAVR